MAACIKILPNLANITKNQTIKCLTPTLTRNYCCDSKKNKELQEVTHTGQVYESILTLMCYANILLFHM